MDRRKGFALIEILLVIVIMAAVAALAFPFLHYFQAGADLNNNAQELKNILRLAQSKTLASELSSSWGVYLGTTSPQKYVLFKGQSYLQRDAAFDEIHPLPNRIEFYQVSLTGAGSEVVFQKITGATQNYGSISLRMVSDHSRVKTIYVESQGRLQVADSLPSSPPPSPSPSSYPIYDPKGFRHVHFNYSRSVDTGAEKIILTFTNGASSVVKELSLADYLKDGEFSWEGEIQAFGSPQRLKIHTHRLNNPDTQLCIHRETDHNNQALKVDLFEDPAISPDLANYSADGFSLTKGNSIFVSDPLPQ